MNYIIYDNIHDNNGFIAEALIEKGIGIKEIYSPVSRYKCISWIMGAVKEIQKSSSGDRLIFWYDFQGVICFWICRLFLAAIFIICGVPSLSFIISISK